MTGKGRNLVFVTNSDFLITKSLQQIVVDLRYSTYMPCHIHALLQLKSKGTSQGLYTVQYWYCVLCTGTRTSCLGGKPSAEVSHPLHPPDTAAVTNVFPCSELGFTSESDHRVLHQQYANVIFFINKINVIILNNNF